MAPASDQLKSLRSPAELGRIGFVERPNGQQSPRRDGQGDAVPSNAVYLASSANRAIGTREVPYAAHAGSTPIRKESDGRPSHQENVQDVLHGDSAAGAEMSALPPFSEHKIHDIDCAAVSNGR